MCEIAVCDPEQCGIEAMQQIAYTFNEEQGDGLGVLAVKNLGDKFEYEVYRSTDPHWQTLYTFMKRHVDSTWRFVIHGRYGTAGGVKREHCHPLNVGCEQCDFEYVVHNGSVRNHEQNRASLISHGHDFETQVDSEVIAHKIEELPETVEDHDYDTYALKGKLNYLVFSEDGILAKVQHKYDLTEQFTMTCSRTDFQNAGELGFTRANNRWALVTPDGADPAVETKERSYTRRSGAGTTSHGHAGYSGHGSRTQNVSSTWPSDQEPEPEPEDEGAVVQDDEILIAYEDLVPNIDGVSCVRVAPGVLRLKQEQADTIEYVYRDHNPRLYYYYSDEKTPDNIEHLEELADARPAHVDEEQQTLDEVDEGNVEEAVGEAVATTLENVAEGDIEEIQNQIVEAVSDGRTAATTGE